MPDNVQERSAATVPEAPWATMACIPDDGPAARAKIGLIVLANDAVIEPELRAFLPTDGVALYASRIPMAITLSVETLRAMEADIARIAAAIMPDDELDVIGFGCTSGSMAIGDDRVAARIREGRPGVATTNPITAGLEGLRAVGARRIALLTPYPVPVNRVVEDFITARGFEIAARGSFMRKSDPEIARVPPAAIHDATVELGKTDVDAVFVSCTALRVSPVLGAAEAAIGKPVVSSNQALAWHCLRLAGYDDPVPGFGRLMTI